MFLSFPITTKLVTCLENKILILFMRRVVENTKEYLCRAVVTVVDHLGSVSANLDYRLSNDCAFSETEFRINGLKQVSINTMLLLSIMRRPQLARIFLPFICQTSRAVAC